MEKSHEKRKRKIPGTWEEKVEVWKTWAEGTPWYKLAANLYDTFELTDYRCRRLKREFEELSLAQLASLEGHPALLARHPLYGRYLNRKAQPERWNKVEHHVDVLSEAALAVAEQIAWYTCDIGNETLEQLAEKETASYSDRIETLKATEAKWVLSHIKTEMPDLFLHLRARKPELFPYEKLPKSDSKEIIGWTDFTLDDLMDVGERLVDLLKTMAARKKFGGICEVCKDWPTFES